VQEHPESDVQVCDCCGNGEEWYGEPGHHYGENDPPGHGGPYADNGGYCKCH
jgi:alpha-glucuronidase